MLRTVSTGPPELHVGNFSKIPKAVHEQVDVWSEVMNQTRSELAPAAMVLTTLEQFASPAAGFPKLLPNRQYQSHDHNR